MSRPVTVLFVENDGPRGPFRKKVRKKLAAWKEAGELDPGDRLIFLTEPWGKVNLRWEEHRAALAEFMLKREVELLVIGPIVSVGMIGGGTPDEVAAFESLLRDLRARMGRPLAIHLIHHENVRGEISGAWERVPDVLTHVTAISNGRTRIFWQKTRYGSKLHRVRGTSAGSAARGSSGWRSRRRRHRRRSRRP